MKLTKSKEHEESKRVKILIVQRTLTHYRKVLFERLASNTDFEYHIFTMDKIVTNSDILKVRSFHSTNIRINAFNKKYLIPYSASLIRAVESECNDYDFIILEGATNLAVNLVLNRKLKGKRPYIIWDAGRRRNAKTTPIRRIAQLPLVKIWSDASAIMAYSSIAREYFLSIGIDENKIFVCQNTLSVSDFDNEIKGYTLESINNLKAALGSGKRIVLYVGAIEQRKHVDDLIYAFKQLNYKNAHLVIIGDGDDLSRLKGIVEDENIEDVSFLGSIIEGVIQYFLTCDLFVLPSEGGLSINQAMICGKPVIASSADGTEIDLINSGKNGFLFEEGDIHSLAQLIDVVLSDASRIEIMGKNSRKIIDENVNENRFALAFLDCLESTIAISNNEF